MFKRVVAIILSVLMVTSMFTVTSAEDASAETTVQVSTQAELFEAIANASEDAENPTEIVLLNDIECTDTSTNNGHLYMTNKYINFSGGYDIIKAHTKPSRRDYGQMYQKGFVVINGGCVNFDGVDIDLNVDDSRSIGGAGFYIYGSAKVTVTNAEIRDGGFSKISNMQTDAQRGMAVYIAGTATFTLGENSKITGFSCYETNTNPTIIGVDGSGSTLIIDGGEISGNTIKGEYGIIYGSNFFTAKLLSGKITDNVWLSEGEIARDIRMNTNNGSGTLYLGGEMELENPIAHNGNSAIPRITSALLYDVEVERITAPETGYANNSGTTSSVYYKSYIATGSSEYEYTLTKDDLNKISYKDDIYGVYLDTIYRTSDVGYGHIYLYDDTHGVPAYDDIIEKDKYTVKFYDSDLTTVISEQEIVLGKSATAPEDPVKASDGVNSFEFTGWDKDFSAVTENLDIYPIFETVDLKTQYTVKFYDSDLTTVISEQTVEAGNSAKAPEDPTKTAENFKYEFTGWDKDFSAVTENMDIYPVFTEIALYTVTFYNGDGSVLDTQIIEDGQAATAPETTPTKTADENGRYIFTNWDTDFSAVTENLDVNPVFIQMKIYTVTFYNGDGSVIEAQDIEEGEDATAPTTVPTKAAEGAYRFRFASWDKEFTNITADLSVYPVFTELDRYNITVTNETELREAVAEASDDSANPTTITLANDIEFTSDTSKGNLVIYKKYINFAGGYDILKANKKYTHWSYNGKDSNGVYWERAFITVYGGSVTFNGVDVDMNADADNSLGGRAFYIYGSGTVTVKNAEIRNGGFAENGNGGTNLGMAAYIGAGKLVLGEGSKITGFEAYSTSTSANIITVEGTGATLEINGGEISGNTVAGDYGVIYGGNLFTARLTSGSIKDNTWLNEGAVVRSIRMNTNNGSGVLYLGGEMYLEEPIAHNSNAGIPQITSALLYDVVVERLSNPETGYTDNNGNSNSGYYKSYIAAGTSSHTLTKDDLNKISYRDDVYGIYLDTIYRTTDVGYGHIYLYDDEHGIPEFSDIIKKGVFTVTFYNGDGSVLDTQEVMKGEAATAPANPTKESDGASSYEFTGWDTDFSNVATDLEVRPLFEAVALKEKYTVNFYDSDLTTVISEQIVEDGNSATAPEAPAKADGDNVRYVFAGWDKDFSSVTENLDIYPEYTEVALHTVTFYNGDGSVLETQKVEDGKSATEPATVPTKANSDTYCYTFAKWDTDFSNITADLSVYPEFTESIITYNVKFCDTDGTVLKEETIEIGNKTTAPEYTAAAEYTFKGWAVSGTVDVIDFETYVLTGDTTFVPVCEYTVTFNDNNGELIAEVESVGGLITPPDAPTAEDGMSFVGWAAEGTENTVRFTKAVTPGTVFVPIYKPTKSIKIFTIGHSYGVNANYLLPRVLSEAGYTDITIGMVFAPGCSLEAHYRGKTGNNINYYKNTTGDPRDWKIIKDGAEYPFSGGSSSLGNLTTSIFKALTDEDWDIIVMQDSVSGAGRPEDGCYNEYLPLMIEWVKENKTNPDAEFAWHMLWANEQIHPNGEVGSNQQSFGYAFDGDEGVMYKAIVDTVQTKIVPNEDIKYIIPAGTLIQNLRNAYSVPFTGDSIHADHQIGSYPISMLWAEVLLGVDADTINYVPELDEYQSTQSVQQITEEFLDTAHDIITKTIAEPYKITVDGPQEVYPIMSVDFGEPTVDGDNYTYTATVYLEQYGNIHGVGAVNDEENQTVTETGNYAGLKIKDWNLNVTFENTSDLVSVGTVDSSLKVVDGYNNGEATYIAPDMTVSANGGTVKVTSSTAASEKMAYPYYGITRYHQDGKLALGTFEITTKTDNFHVNMSADLQYGNTYANGEFIEDESKTTYVTNKTGDTLTLIMNTEVMVGQPVAIDDPDDGLITSEAELREALAGTLSKDSANPTKIVLGADIILDDGAETEDDLTDGTLTIGNADADKVYVDISGDYTIKNMQNLSGVYLLNITNADVNITDTVIDMNYNNDSGYATTNTSYKASVIRAITSNLALNGTATIKNGYGGRAIYAGKSGDAATFTMNDNSKITGWRLDKSWYSASLIYIEGNNNNKFIMNGGEISNNVFGSRGMFHVDANHAARPQLNAGKIINNDATKTQTLFTMNQGGNGYVNPAGMEFNDKKTVIWLGSGNTIKIKSALTQELQRFGHHYTTSHIVTPCFKGSDGYQLTLSDLQLMSASALSVNGYPMSRVMALNTETNIVYSYLSIDDVPEGCILADGTVVGEVVIVDSITGVTEASGVLTVSYQLSPDKTVTGTPLAAIYKGSEVVNATYDTNTQVSLSGDSNTGTIKLDAPSDWATNKGDYKIKFFIWNPATIAPQIDVLEYKAE